MLKVKQYDFVWGYMTNSLDLTKGIVVEKNSVSIMVFHHRNDIDLSFNMETEFVFTKDVSLELLLLFKEKKFNYLTLFNYPVWNNHTEKLPLFISFKKALCFKLSEKYT